MRGWLIDTKSSIASKRATKVDMLKCLAELWVRAMETQTRADDLEVELAYTCALEFHNL